ncbi:MAG TPA: DNA-processing protein DprA [Patescibacteria group bacterium]|nr:DNA-processing protein DprA [Patescibacteria group bacterium]
MGRGSFGDADRDALAVLLSVDGLGPLTLGRLVDRLGSPAAILEAAAGPDGAATLVQGSRAGDGEWRAMPHAVAQAIGVAAANQGKLLEAVTRSGLRVVARGDPDYPHRLLAIEIPPPALFVRGSLASLGTGRVVAVVGTRRPSLLGRRIASRIATALARADATVVSGLAIGIDGAAHAACVTEGVPTVAFIGGGHARLFPRAHDRLADAIVEGGGAVVSEYAPTVRPTRGTFPQRNRLISGASDAVVVVEAGARSGALVTASWALEQGRECFIVPGSIDSPTAAGCNGFLRDWHGLARIVSGVPQLLEDLGLLAAAGLPAGPGAETDNSGNVIVRSSVRLPSAGAVLSGRDGAQVAVAEALIHGAVIVDELVAVTRLSVGAVLGALTRLEAAGLARPSHGRYEPMGPLAAVDPKAA